ncbi:Alpha/beta hydrolase family protein [Actinomadura glauciflava]|uniref:alpha/beta hydrolase family protein n=1 Tax=Actinomadura luteofluorescens TaxID=46163 RepID=UPI002164C746|nr:alpha/beta hydrolase [Actinomadura glauciflava]MCR3745531.1 Alpha/beta hydrolase family protein [Actinomadura glauciflava]
MAHFFKKDTQFEFEFIRTMGQTSYGAAEIGECLATAARIVEGDYDSWHDEWFDTAQWLFDRSAEAESRHGVSARDGYLRCANYYRTAEFFLHGSPGDPRIHRTSKMSVESFRRAARLHEPGIEEVEVPYGTGHLPAYFFRAAGQSSAPKPTVIIHNGFDGTAEEIYSFGGRAGQERGYHILAFEGPGQGQVIRSQGLTFRPDWEHVVGPVVDYLETRDDVDAERIALIGISMGGVLAPRAAAFEQRLAAVVAWDGVYDMSTVALDFVLGELPDPREVLIDRIGAESDVELDEYIQRRISESGTARWFFDHGSWVMGTESPRMLLKRICDFNVRDGVAEQIKCPVLVLEADEDMALDGQPAQLVQHLTAPYAHHSFTARRGGELHNQVDVMRHASSVIYDWLDAVLQP